MLTYRIEGTAEASASNRGERFILAYIPPGAQARPLPATGRQVTGPWHNKLTLEREVATSSNLKTSWLAGEGSNLQPPDPKSGVLPVELPAKDPGTKLCLGSPRTTVTPSIRAFPVQNRPLPGTVGPCRFDALGSAHGSPDLPC